MHRDAFPVFNQHRNACKRFERPGFFHRRFVEAGNHKCRGIIMMTHPIPGIADIMTPCQDGANPCERSEEKHTIQKTQSVTFSDGYIKKDNTHTNTHQQDYPPGQWCQLQMPLKKDSSNKGNKILMNGAFFQMYISGILMQKNYIESPGFDQDYQRCFKVFLRSTSFCCHFRSPDLAIK